VRPSHHPSSSIGPPTAQQPERFAMPKLLCRFTDQHVLMLHALDVDAVSTV
jgi:hypothetical protein